MANDTLLIKHLPSQLTNAEKEGLARHFGAVEVKCLSSVRNKYNAVFARFSDSTIAENVLHRLHQLDVLGSCLSVEFAKGKSEFAAPPTKQLTVDDDEEETQSEKYYKKFLARLNAWHCGVDFKQPVPSHLYYQYPPPDLQVLQNIAKVLATVPKFYTQVIHLMNKMNLPCPFGQELLPHIFMDVDQVLSRPAEVSLPAEVGIDSETSGEEMESELSSDEELKKSKDIIPVTHRVQNKKPIKVPKFIKPVTVNPQKKTKKAKFEEVFETISEEKNVKKSKLSHSTLETSSKDPEQDGSKGGFGFIHPLKPREEVKEPEKVDLRDEREEERLEKEVIVCISKAELEANRILEKDRSVLPVFRNYAEGAATCRLYIKNLAKTVTEQDLRFIYSRYIPQTIIGEPSMFDVRLMQEGRMKGQAFVTVQTIELAQKALKETNGYILKDKPLVVQFARSATKQ